MLRGAQTPGELKQRTERLHRFDDLGDVIETLDALTGRELVERLDRRPGQKEERYRHLLGGEETSASAAAPRPVEAAERPPNDLEHRIASLESEVADLRFAIRSLEGGGD